MYFPCKNFTSCPGDEAGTIPQRNFSAENPDAFTRFGFFQCDLTASPNPPFSTCTSITSQAAADWCSAMCLPRGVYVNTLQTGVSACGVTFTAPAGMFLGVSVQAANATALAYALAAANKLCLFSNTAQNCVVTCADNTSQNYTVPAGAIKAATLSAANSAAMALACETAALQCFGVLVANEGQSCSVLCAANGGTVSYTVPAGVVHHLSLAAANARALELACQLALIACSELPPLIDNEPQSCSQICQGESVSFTVPFGAFVALTQLEANNIAFIFACAALSLACQEDDLPPEGINVANSAQSCSVPCESGSGTFSFTVPRGAFRLENRAAANAAALSYACSHAYAQRFCLGSIAPGICVNEVFASVIPVTGPGSPTVIGITGGSIPPGLSLSGGLISGIPTTPGVFSFQITAADDSGNFAQNNYTVTVAEIVTVVLPDGDTSTPYAQAIVTNGFTDPVFTIVGGALPTPLTLHPATGVISGDAPTEDGPFAFVVQVQDSNATCLQDYVLTVTAAAVVQMYWKLDSAVPALNTDSVTGQVLFINNFGAVITGVPAVISNGLQITGGFANISESNVAAEYLGTGWTFAFWIRWSSVGTGNEGFQWVFGSAPLQAITWIIGNGEYHFPYDPGELTGNTPLLAADVFHFVVFRYDPATGNLSYSFDGAAFVNLPGNAGVMPVQATGSGSYVLIGNEEVIVDELGAFGFPINAAQLAYLYNGGAGRTYPFSFPP